MLLLTYPTKLSNKKNSQSKVNSISDLFHSIDDSNFFIRHLVAAKPPFQFEEHQSTTNAPRPQACRPPSNPALKDACIQIFTANNNSQVPPT